MSLLVVNALLALIWAALIGRFSLETLLVGFALGYLTLYLIRGVLGDTAYFSRGARLVRFILYFLWELLVANLRVARDVLWPGPLRMRPRVIAVPLDRRGDVEVTILANVISLTPGTLNLDVAEDRGTLFVHFMDAPDPDEAREELKSGFQRLVFDLIPRGAESTQVDGREEN